MEFASGPLSLCAPIGERQLLFVAARAGLSAVDRHALVVKETASRYNLLGRHRVAGRNRRARKWLGNVPVERGLPECRARKDDEQKADSMHGRLRFATCHTRREFPASVAMLRAAVHRTSPGLRQ